MNFEEGVAGATVVTGESQTGGAKIERMSVNGCKSQLDIYMMYGALGG